MMAFAVEIDSAGKRRLQSQDRVSRSTHAESFFQRTYESKTVPSSSLESGTRPRAVGGHVSTKFASLRTLRTISRWLVSPSRGSDFTRRSIFISFTGWPVVINLSKATVGSREISFDRKSARNNSLPRRALQRLVRSFFFFFFFFIEDRRSHERSNNFISCHLYSTRDESNEKLSSYPSFVIQFRYYLTKPLPFFFFLSVSHSFASISLYEII